MAVATDERSVLDRAAEVLAELADRDLDGLADGELTETVLGLQRLRGALGVAEARVLARWDARKVWRDDGARTAAAWLAAKQHLPVQTARQRLRHARAMRTLPEVERAWRVGEIDRTHLITLLGARTPRTRDAFETDHKVLLDAARTMGFADFKRRCDVWESLVDPDGAEQGADADRDAREVHLSQSFGGMWFGRMTLDPISGEIVQRTLSPIERELFDADWAEAKERLGRDPMVFELRRTPAQRRADALVEMATRARTAPADGRRPAPLFSVLVGYETLAGPTLELFNRTVLTPGTAARWLTEADVERIVFDTPSRVIDVGAQRRFFRGALRRAIEIRDRTCFHPLCDEVPDRLEIDHIHEAARGGATTQVNGRGGCGFHNRLRNRHPDPGHDLSPDHGDPHAGPDPPE
ncbi:MAG: DUF222 domain-containing protein [Acidimicrobiales bacterium]